MKPTPAQQRLLDAAAARADGHVIGGNPRTRQVLRDRGWTEVYDRHFGPLDRLTAAGRALASAKPKLKLCAACEREYKRHARVSRFFPRWTCRKCGDVCCEHLCGNKANDAATCGSCIIRRNSGTPCITAR